jgi:hypothetical protein
MEEEKKIIWLPKVTSWKALIGSCALQWEDAPPVPKALCQDGKALCCDGETLNCDEEPMEWQRDYIENIMNVMG